MVSLLFTSSPPRRPNQSRPGDPNSAFRMHVASHIRPQHPRSFHSLRSLCSLALLSMAPLGGRSRPTHTPPPPPLLESGGGTGRSKEEEEEEEGGTVMRFLCVSRRVSRVLHSSASAFISIRCCSVPSPGEAGGGGRGREIRGCRGFLTQCDVIRGGAAGGRGLE